ncbi:MAG TPA: M23 family metallopeptidase [Actinomycetota bacterium]|nr:M23 family metallopeptidase [Actinomycetota bacterium]
MTTKTAGRKSAARRSRLVAALATLMLLAGVDAGAPTPASAAVAAPSDCRSPNVPPHFHTQVATAIRLSRNLPMAWSKSPYLAKIVCWQDTGFDTSFVARAPWHRWHGEFAMTVEEMRTIAGPWLSDNRHELILKPRCFVRGWDACPHTTVNTRVVQQLIAGMRWIWLMYGRPATAWHHIVRTDRFNSYPRPGTDDSATTHPFSVCPVKGTVSYRDDFGVPRSTGGYHPHEGNDVHASIGRPIRAPFSGYAVAHTDTWFAGRSVGLVGDQGFVRNAHLSRFGHLGYVRAGTVIGYVGQTGDALTPHDHFEWHPWIVPEPLHVAPSSFRRILDAVDPYPFLNKVCTRG